MGSFQKGMGESLTGRMRKQLDIPRGPKEDIDTNIPLEQIQDMKYLAQVRVKVIRVRVRVAGFWKGVMGWGRVYGWRECPIILRMVIRRKSSVSRYPS